MKSLYELMLVLDVSASETERKKLFEKIEKAISGEGKITDKIDLGKKTLAYPVKKKKEANYWLLKLETVGKEAALLSNKLRLEELVLRLLLV